MNLQIQIATLEKRTAWDEYVGNHPLGTPYQRFAWVHSVEQAYQHQNVSLLAYLDNKVVGVLPCVKMQRPFSKPSLCSLPFCDLGYCLADTELIQTALLEHALKSLKKTGGKKYDYRGTSQEEQEMTDVEGKKVRMLLTLPADSELLMNSFKSKLRSQIRKADKNGLTFTIANTQQQIDDFYTIFSINMRKLGSPVHSKRWFQCLFENFAENIVLSVVYTGQTAIGAGIVIRNASKVSIPWASTVAEHNKLAPNMMLYWSLLKHSCDLGCNEFDFGRSTYGEGTFKFKQQWGAQPRLLDWLELPGGTNKYSGKKQSLDNKTNKLRPLVEQLWSKLPLAMTTTIGPKIRKHISL